MVKCCVIGCGVAGSTMPRSHCEGYHEHPQCRLILVVDVEKKAAKKAAKKWGARAYSTSVSAISVAKPDVISIATPEESHVEVLREILTHWTPAAIFMEKPLATSVSGCNEIIERCQKLGVVLAVNHARAWDTDIRRRQAPKLISVGGGTWRNDVHAMHLRALWPEAEIQHCKTSGLWVDGEPLWGKIRRNVMTKAISDLLLSARMGKETKCGGNDGRAAVRAVLSSQILPS